MRRRLGQTRRKPQLFRTVEQWREIAAQRGISFIQAAIEYEKDFSGWTGGQIWDYFEKIDSIFDAQVHSLERMGYENAADTPNLPIYGKAWNRYDNCSQECKDSIKPIITEPGSVQNEHENNVRIAHTRPNFR